MPYFQILCCKTTLVLNLSAIVQREIKARGGQFKLVQGVTRIGTRIDDVDNDKIIDNMNRNQENDGSQDSSEEDEEEGIDVDLDGDDIQDEDN